MVEVHNTLEWVRRSFQMFGWFSILLFCPTIPQFPGCSRHFVNPFFLTLSRLLARRMEFDSRQGQDNLHTSLSFCCLYSNYPHDVVSLSSCYSSGQKMLCFSGTWLFITVFTIAHEVHILWYYDHAFVAGSSPSCSFVFHLCDVITPLALNELQFELVALAFSAVCVQK